MERAALSHIFISHTKHDVDFCDRFDRAVARVNLSAFRSEFEDFEYPPWKTIIREMQRSKALFLLIGKELVRRQELSVIDEKERKDWAHTQNWIAYEVGLASQLGIDVWVFCDNVEINFPVPYFNNYYVQGLNGPTEIKWLKTILTQYEKESNFNYGFNTALINTCPNVRCNIEFNFHTTSEDDGITIICPSCLNKTILSQGKMKALRNWIKTHPIIGLY